MAASLKLAPGSTLMVLFWFSNWTSSMLLFQRIDEVYPCPGSRKKCCLPWNRLYSCGQTVFPLCHPLEPRPGNRAGSSPDNFRTLLKNYRKDWGGNFYIPQDRIKKFPAPQIQPSLGGDSPVYRIPDKNGLFDFPFRSGDRVPLVANFQYDAAILL